MPYSAVKSSNWAKCPAFWRIFRRSPLSEENYPNRNPAWKQALLITDFQGNTRKGSSTSLSEENYPNRNPAWKQALLIADFQGDTRKGSSTSLSVACIPYDRNFIPFLYEATETQGFRNYTSFQRPVRNIQYNTSVIATG